MDKDFLYGDQIQINFQERLNLYQKFYLNFFKEFQHPIDFLASMPGNFGDHLICRGCMNLFNFFPISNNSPSSM